MTISNNTSTREITVIIKGNFDIDITPQTDDSINTGRMLINKNYHGDMTGMSQGQMLSLRTKTEGSGAYVAIEHFTGTINGLSGSLTLQHTGSMCRGVDSLSVVIVPDSGLGELTGISGNLQINITKGQHFYQLEYSINKD